MRRFIACAAIGAIALTACSSTSDSKSDAKPLAAKRAAKKTATTTLPFAAATEHTPGTLKNYEGARADVHDTKCDRDGKRWNATGKVTNSTKHAVKYRIYVSFLSGDTTVGIAETSFGPVKADETKDWSTTVKVAASDLRCVLRVERADV